MSIADENTKSIGAVDRNGPAWLLCLPQWMRHDELRRLEYLVRTDRYFLEDQVADGTPDCLPLPPRSTSLKNTPAIVVPKQFSGLILDRDRKLPVDVVLANLKLVARHGHDNRLRRHIERAPIAPCSNHQGSADRQTRQSPTAHVNAPNRRSCTSWSTSGRLRRRAGTSCDNRRTQSPCRIHWSVHARTEDPA